MIRPSTMVMAATTALFLTTEAPAQSVPALVNYQGRLTDQTGNPLSAGSYTIQFRLLDSPTLENLIWDQQQNVTLQSGGAFNVLLGSPGGTPITGTSPAFSNLADAFAGSSRFLGLTVTVSNGVTIASPNEILPRQQLLTVPYAFSATSASVASSVTPGSITSTSIGSGQVTQGNLAPRQVGQIVGPGGVALSPTVAGNFTNLAVTITTTGRPIFVGLIPDGSGNVGIIATQYGTTIENSERLGILRDGSSIANTIVDIQVRGSSPPAIPWLAIPCGALNTIDFPPAGTHTYGVQGDSSYIPAYCKLVAYEL